MSWQDKNGKTAARLRSKSFETHLPIYDAIDKINEILLAFKLVRIGHIDGCGLRTVGIDDTLFYFSRINDQHAAWGIFACVKTLTVLSQNHMIKADFAVEFFRHSKLTAAWTKNAPNWVPSGPSAESMDLNS